MKSSKLIGSVVGLLAILGLSRVALAAPKSCDPTAVAAAQAAIAGACPCAAQASGESWKNHGQYVGCVAHETAKQIAQSHGALSRRCLRSEVSCGARSTCGKPDFFACTVSVAHTCTGDPIPGDGTAAGTCDNPPHLACDTDADCTTTRCSIKSSAELCSGVATTGSCCQ